MPSNARRYIEVPATNGCEGCMFHHGGGNVTCTGVVGRCKWWSRPDRKSIIFKKAEKK